MTARVLSTSSHVTLYIPRGWDVFTYDGRTYRISDDGLVAEYCSRQAGRPWRASSILRVEAA